MNGGSTEVSKQRTGMSYDALMRWEWEGGTPAFVNEFDAAPNAGLAGNNTTLTQPRPTSRRAQVRRDASASPPPREDRQGDGRER